jgi:hypothetical protein
MSTSPIARLSLEVALDASPVSGELTSEDGLRDSFSGWTELFALLEATLARVRAGSGRPGELPEPDIEQTTVQVANGEL